MTDVTLEVKKESFVTDQIKRLVSETNLPIKKENLLNLFNKRTLDIYSVIVNGENLGIIICRVDYNFNGNNELVIMFSIAEKEISQPLHHVLCPVYDRIAKGKDIRIHSSRESVSEFLVENGFDFLETVYVKKAEDVNKKPESIV